MTLNLFGRWQTRLLLFATVGVLVTLPFFQGYIGPTTSSNTNSAYFWSLGYIAFFGLGWDALYIYLQQFRWDRDWPAIFQLLAGIWEGVFAGVILAFFQVPGVPQFDPYWFAVHYSVVWLAIFLASQSLMRILFPYWRFRGGKWI